MLLHGNDKIFFIPLFIFHLPLWSVSFSFEMCFFSFLPFSKLPRSAPTVVESRRKRARRLIMHVPKRASIFPPFHASSATSSASSPFFGRSIFFSFLFFVFFYTNLAVGPEEEKLLGSILLPSYRVTVCRPEDKVNRKFAFKAEHANMRTYHFAAESRESMNQWVNALTLATLLQDPSP